MTSDEERTSHDEAGRRGPDTYVLRVSGNMDLDHSDALRSSFLTAVAEAPRGTEIVFDLQNSSFCDSTGLNVLLAARELALESGHGITLAAPSHQMVRLLEITGSVELFDFGPAVPT